MPRRSSPDALSRAIGARVRELRLDAGLTLEKLAYESDLGSKGHLSDLEQGLVRPTIHTLAALSDRLGVRLVDIVNVAPRDQRTSLLEAMRGREQAETHVALPSRARSHLGAEHARPFDLVKGAKARRPRNALPLVDLHVVMGRLDARTLSFVETWVRPRTARKLDRDMFVSRVEGRGFVPFIPHGAYALFSKKERLHAAERIVLVLRRERDASCLALEKIDARAPRSASPRFIAELLEVLGR